MLRARIIRTIFLKEMRETLRDRRTLLLMIGLPVVLYPILLLGFTSVRSAQVAARQTRTSAVGLWGAVPEELLAAITEDEELVPLPWAGAPDELRAMIEAGRYDHLPGAWRQGEGESGGESAGNGNGNERDDGDAGGRGATSPDDPMFEALRLSVRRAIAEGACDVVLLTPTTLGAVLDAGDAGAIDAYFDSVDPDSSQAASRVAARLAELNADLLRDRLKARGLPEGFSRGLEVWTADVAPPTRTSGHKLGLVLPFVLILMSLLGGFYPSIDLTAGEKERGTMQTLLCAPLLPAEIIAGKFLAVSAVSITTGLANIASIAATTMRAFASANVELAITPGALAVTFLLFIPVSLITSAVFLAVGAFAKDFKDGQNFITPVYLLLGAPIGLTVLPDFTLTAATSFIPVLNLGLLMKAILIGEAEGAHVFLTLVSSGAYTALAILLAVRVFEREQVLLGGKEPLLQTLGLHRRTGELPSPSFAVAWFTVSLVALFYGTLAIDPQGSIERTLLVTQLGIILPAALLPVLAFGFAGTRTLSLRPPPPRGLIAGALIGVSGWTVAATLTRLLPPPPELVEDMRKILMLEQPLVVALALAALLPATCEELLFRGTLLSGLRRSGPWVAIIVTAVFFGLFHGSVHRLIPTVFLGACFGLLVWRTGSVWCSIIAHALNNGLLVAMARAQENGVQGLPIADETLPLGWAAGGAVGLALGIGLAMTVKPPGEREG